MRIHVITTQEHVYQGERYASSETRVACSCGVAFDNVFDRPDCFPMPNNEHCLTVAALITKHKLDVIATALRIRFEEKELEAEVHPDAFGSDVTGSDTTTASTNNGMTHYVGDTCPGSHRLVSEKTLRKTNKGYCGKCGDSKPECKCPKKARR